MKVDGFAISLVDSGKLAYNDKLLLHNIDWNTLPDLVMKSGDFKK